MTELAQVFKNCLQDVQKQIIKRKVKYDSINNKSVPMY